MVDGFDDQSLAVVILQNRVKCELDVFPLANILQVSSDWLVVQIDWLKKGEKSFDDFKVCFFKALI